MRMNASRDLLIVETVKRRAVPLTTVKRTFHLEGPLYLPDYEAPFGHVLVHWLVAELWRMEHLSYDPVTDRWYQRPVQLDVDLCSARDWFHLAAKYGVRTLFGYSTDTSPGLS